MGRQARYLALTLLSIALPAAAALATPTGLNNIPTAYVVPDRVLVLQGFTEFGRDRTPSWFTGLKYGPAPHWEIGIDDTTLGLASEGGPVLQAKREMALSERTAVGLGLANVSNDTDRNGKTFPYAVVSSSQGSFTGHLGYSFQQDNHAWFVGADTTVAGKLTLRADWIQVLAGEESVTSFGFLTPLSPRWLVEGWASVPSAEGTESWYVLKRDYVVPLARM